MNGVGVRLAGSWLRRTVRAGATAVCVSVFVAAACHRTQTAAPGTPVGDDLLAPYLQIHEGLSKDSFAGVNTNAAAIADAAGKHGALAVGIETAARRLQAVTTLGEARDQFGALSEALVAYRTRTGGRLPPDVRQAYCPMAQKPWLQRGSMIANPYYGKEMPNCGEFK